MERIVVVSTNNNPDYFFYSPFILKAWNSYGWKVCVMITHDVPEAVIHADYIVRVEKIDGLRDATVAQASRLYAANHLPEDALIMTSDMDLLPLSDYWHPNENDITVYGHDLTDFSYFPMGYTAMTGKKWKEIFRLNGETEKELERDMKEIEIAYSDDWQAWWNADWTLSTKRIKESGQPVNFINRGRRANSSFAYGRIDRGDSMQIPAGETLIDAHCENNNVQHPDKLSKFLSIFESVHGKL